MIKVAIVGTGSISQQHIKGYLEFPDRCKIVALVDIYPEKADEKKLTFNLTEADVYDNYKKILNRTDIDLIDICTPPYVHAEITIDSLLASKNVLVEKPMASSLEECDAMLVAEKKSGKLLSVISQNRFRTEFMNLKRTLDSKIAGDLVHAEVDSLWWRGHSYYDLWWRGTWEKEGGGCTLNHAVHYIDITAWMLGMPEEITSVFTNTSHDNSEVEDLSIAILKYPTGALAQITSSVVHHGEDQQIVLQCKNARISAPFKVSSCKAMSNGFPEKNIEMEQKINDYYEKLPESKYKGHTAQIDDVLTALENNTKPLICGEDGKKTIELITSIYKSASTKQPVKLPITSLDEFYTVEGIHRNVPHFHEKSSSVTNFNNENITF